MAEPDVVLPDVARAPDRAVGADALGVVRGDVVGMADKGIDDDADRVQRMGDLLALANIVM